MGGAYKTRLRVVDHVLIFNMHLGMSFKGMLSPPYHVLVNFECFVHFFRDLWSSPGEICHICDLESLHTTAVLRQQRSGA